MNRQTIMHVKVDVFASAWNSMNPYLIAILAADFRPLDSASCSSKWGR